MVSSFYVQAGFLAAPLSIAMADKSERRRKREDAIRKFNVLAQRAELSVIPVRASAEQVVELYSTLCGELDDYTELAAAREMWINNGGEDLDESLMDVGADSKEGAAVFPGGEEPVQAHHRLHTSGKSFRLRARAFMLTFNSIAFAAATSSDSIFRQDSPLNGRHVRCRSFPNTWARDHDTKPLLRQQNKMTRGESC